MGSYFRILNKGKTWKCVCEENTLMLEGWLVIDVQELDVALTMSVHWLRKRVLVNIHAPWYGKDVFVTRSRFRRTLRIIYSSHFISQRIFKPPSLVRTKWTTMHNLRCKIFKYYSCNSSSSSREVKMLSDFGRRKMQLITSNRHYVNLSSNLMGESEVSEVL